MKESDSKVTELTELRKKKLPIAQTGMRDISEIMTELIEVMQAQGMKALTGSSMGGWTFSVKQGDE